MIIKTMLSKLAVAADEDREYSETNYKQLEWIHLKSPTADEIHSVYSHYDFPVDFITAALDPYEVSRTEEYINGKGEKIRLHVFLYPINDLAEDAKDQYKIASLSIIEFKDGIITAGVGDLPFITALQEEPYLDIDGPLTPFTFTMSLFWIISQRYIEMLMEIDDNIHELETKVAFSTSNDILFQLIGLNKGLVYFASAIEGNKEILHHLEREYDEQTDHHDQADDPSALIRTIRIEQHQASVMIENSHKIMDKLTVMLTNLINNNMNQIMKNLTTITIMFTIATVTSGLWGMNVLLPFAKTPMAFLVIVGIIITMIIIVYFVLKRNKFL